LSHWRRGSRGIDPDCFVAFPIKEQVMARKRELIDTGTDRRYVRRNKRGTSFVESDDVGRLLAAVGGDVPRPRPNQDKATRVTEPVQKPSAGQQRRRLAGKAPLGSLPGDDDMRQTRQRYNKAKTPT
jgi:hypothetical protein